MKITKFDNNYPKIDSLGLFTKRHEISFVFQDKAEELLIKKIKEVLPESKIKREMMATTYFDPPLVYEPERICIVRFRQRSINNRSIRPPVSKHWILDGPGSFEVKIRKNGSREDAAKMGTFLPEKRGKNIYSLLRLARVNKSNEALIKFITKANFEQTVAMGRYISKNFEFVDQKTLLDVKNSLRPYATRVNMRKTFEMDGVYKTRITLETYPAFYIYPIDYKTQKYNQLHQYEGYLAESPNRCKVEIKTSSRSFLGRCSKSFEKLIKKYGVSDNKYTQEPYYKMVFDVSKKAGTMIDEYQGLEIESKANLKTRRNLFDLINKIRTELIIENGEYQLLPVNPNIKIRGDEELDRTVIGWRDKNGEWHETVTITRVSKEAAMRYGFWAKLKWKSDSQSKQTSVLDRIERKELLRKNPSNVAILKLANRTNGKKNQIVGVMKKWKYRFHVQAKNGLVFVVSLDECTVQNSKKVLQQMEVEYVHTIVMGHNKHSLKTIRDSCDKCIDYFICLLSGLGIKAEKTRFRKIDFLASLFDDDQLGCKK